MFENSIIKQLNADAQESSAADQATEATATTNAPVQAPASEVIDNSAHDDFDWSIDKRNVASYTKEQKEKYDAVYEG
ncbi:MAG TPA: 30S ribosomal protein S1, partial [Niastella sp.]